MRIKKIVLITTGQPSVNPRIVKEADAFAKAGHNVTMLYCHWIEWADEADKIILKGAKWKSILVGGSPTKERFTFYYTKLRFKFYRLLSGHNICKFGVAEKAQSRCYSELLKAARSIKADYFIGHNLGALPIVVNAAATQKTKCGFDFEDYYRGETKEIQNSNLNRIQYLENHYACQCHYISFASPLIASKELLHLKNYKGKISIINNCFLIEGNSPIKKDSDVLKLFWFSQTVGPNRGLENLFKALILLDNKNISLTIIGRVQTDKQVEYNNMILKIPGVVSFLGTVAPNDIHRISSQQDVGLALEPGFSINNDIALSNKVFTYLSTGLAIIFSNTSAQSEFNTTYNVGITYEKADLEDLADCIKLYLNNEKLYEQKIRNWKLANEKLNWEEESKKLLEVIK